MLSKNCIFVLTNNKYNLQSSPKSVVICFQKIVSLFWRTTRSCDANGYWQLWFAFKKLYLCSDEQPTKSSLEMIICCDLLSKNCIFVLTNNSRKCIIINDRVVICFQKIVSLFWRTTKFKLGLICNLLWFAFKKLYLCSDEQRARSTAKYEPSCDLLSKNCIFVLTNNYVDFDNILNIVVICFQKIVSLFWRTTTQYKAVAFYKLWFAFKKLYLCSDEQPTTRLR